MSEKLLGFIVIGVCIVLYLIPTFVAHSRDQPNATAITIINVALGWTLVGWVVALVWAVKEPEAVSIVTPIAPAGAPETTTERPMKTCPACAEEVLAAAKLCKHCGTAFEAPVGV